MKCVKIWRMAFRVEKNKELERKCLSSRMNDVQSLVDGGRRRAEIGLYSNMIFVDLKVKIDET